MDPAIQPFYAMAILIIIIVIGIVVMRKSNTGNYMKEGMFIGFGVVLVFGFYIPVSTIIKLLLWPIGMLIGIAVGKNKEKKK